MWIFGGVFTMVYGVVFALSKSNRSAKNVLHKFNVWIHAVMHLIFTNETRWKPAKQGDPGSCTSPFPGSFPFFLQRERAFLASLSRHPPPPHLTVRIKNCTNIQRKTVIFIRHGESKWNDIFNKGKGITRFGPMFVFRLFKAMFWETVKAVGGDSVFIDSPLSPEGVLDTPTLLHGSVS
jgi:hypothetical protein